MRESLFAAYYFFVIGDIGGTDSSIDPYYHSDYTNRESMSYKGLPMVVVVVAVMTAIFTIWTLNVFVAVISNAWAEQRDKVDHLIMQVRCRLALNYALRATQIPSRIPCLGPLGSLKMNLIAALAIAAILGLQVSTWLNFA